MLHLEGVLESMKGGKLGYHLIIMVNINYRVLTSSKSMYRYYLLLKSIFRLVKYCNDDNAYIWFDIHSLINSTHKMSILFPVNVDIIKLVKERPCIIKSTVCRPIGRTT